MRRFNLTGLVCPWLAPVQNRKRFRPTRRVFRRFGNKSVKTTASRANRKGERTARTNQADTASGRQRSLELFCLRNRSLRFSSLNPMVRSNLPVRIQNTNFTRPAARAGFGIVDGLTLLGKHGLNAKCFKNFPAPPVRFDFNYCH